MVERWVPLTRESSAIFIFVPALLPGCIVQFPILYNTIIGIQGLDGQC